MSVAMELVSVSSNVVRPRAGSGSRTFSPVSAPHRVRVRSPRTARVFVGSAPAAPVRLTQRGVIVLWLLTAVLGAALLLTAYGSWRPSDAPQRVAVATGTVRVQPGDTLWSIAARIAPGRDPRNVVADLRQLNHLGTAALTPGQVLTVK